MSSILFDRIAHRHGIDRRDVDWLRVRNLHDELLAALASVEAFLATVEWTDTTSEMTAVDLRQTIRDLVAKAEDRGL